MKKNSEMLPGYNFRNGVRGKYSARYANGTNIVLLEPDVAHTLPDLLILAELKDTHGSY